MFRRFWFLVLPALLPLASCSKQAPAGPRLVVAINAGVEGGALKAAARDYEKLSGLRMEALELPYGSLFEKEMLDLTSRAGAYDVIMMDDPWFPRLASDGKLSALLPLYRKAGASGPDSDFIETSMALCHQPYPSGALYALPYVGNANFFFYRRDLFERYNLPEPSTWEIVLRAAREIQSRQVPGRGRRMYGYVMRAAPGNAVIADFMPLLWAFGGELFSPEGDPLLNAPEAAEALRFMIELGRWSPRGYVSFNSDELSAHLLQGTAAMCINWPAWLPAMDDPDRSRVIGKVAYAPMPGQRVAGRSALGNWLLAIPAGSKNVEAAFAFIRWATDAPQMRLAAERGNPPTRRSVFQDQEMVRRFSAFPVQLRALETGRPRPRHPNWNEIENVFGVYVSKANSGSVSVDEALARAQAEIAEIVHRGRS